MYYMYSTSCCNALQSDQSPALTCLLQNGAIGTQLMDEMKMKSRASASRLAQQDRAKSQGASPFSLRRPFLKAQTVASAGCLAEPELSGLASAAVYAANAAGSRFC